MHRAKKVNGQVGLPGTGGPGTRGARGPGRLGLTVAPPCLQHGSREWRVAIVAPSALVRTAGPRSAPSLCRRPPLGRLHCQQQDDGDAEARIRALEERQRKVEAENVALRELR